MRLFFFDDMLYFGLVTFRWQLRQCFNGAAIHGPTNKHNISNK